ncbi:MAG: TolC family outer membrane protein [Granulosicoccus sp.]|nr:TolC family outer membrane protein [Granulosicoccus sp.]
MSAPSGCRSTIPFEWLVTDKEKKRTIHMLRDALRLIAVLSLAFSILPRTGLAADLQEVYEQAKSYDTDFREAQFELEAAKESVPLARSSFLPQLSLVAEGGLSTVTEDGEGPYEETLVSLTLNQTLYNRVNGKELDQAKLGLLQAQARYAALEQALILRTATAYFDVLRAQANVEFSQSELQAISRQREQAESRFDVGLVPITDVRSAQAQYDLAVAQEIAAADQFSTAQEALRRISGVDADLLTPLADDLPLTPPQPTDIDAWVELALEQNFELVIARLAAQSSDTQLSIERASRYPTLDLVGSATTTTTELTGLPDRDLAELKLQLRLPIITGGRVNAQVSQAKAEADAARQKLLSQERTTTQQTRDGFRGVRASIARARALRQALVSTQKSAEATEAGFRAGTRTSVEVLQELRDTYRARSDYAGARYDYIINTLNLKAASSTLTEKDILWINGFLAFPE